MSKNNLNQNSIDSLINEQNGWYSNKDFARILGRGRNGWNGTGLPISYIVFNLSSYSEIASDNEYFRFFRELIKVISQNTRGIDIKHLPSKSKIGVLLIGTSLSGNKSLIKRLTHKLYYYLRSLKTKEAHKIIRSIKITSYQLHQIPEHEITEGKSESIKKLEFEKITHESDSRNIMFKRNINYENPNIKISPNGAISLTNPLWWGDDYKKAIITISYLNVKRIIDISGAILFLLSFLPMMLIISIAIKITSKGPIFYKQKRVGYLGKSFIFFKFRTMYTNCDSTIHEEYVKKLINGHCNDINKGTQKAPLYKLTKDPRITVIGKWLRRTSLDEIPQLINVIKGDMSLVGPRPPVPYEVDEYKNWHYRRIMEVKPGITGLWQVSGRNRMTFEEMVKLDIQYAENVSFLLDLKILFKTVKAVLSFEGK